MILQMLAQSFLVRMHLILNANQILSGLSNISLNLILTLLIPEKLFKYLQFLRDLIATTPMNSIFPNTVTMSKKSSLSDQTFKNRKGFFSYQEERIAPTQENDHNAPWEKGNHYIKKDLHPMIITNDSMNRTHDLYFTNLLTIPSIGPHEIINVIVSHTVSNRLKFMKSNQNTMTVIMDRTHFC